MAIMRPDVFFGGGRGYIPKSVEGSHALNAEPSTLFALGQEKASAWQPITAQSLKKG